VQPPPFIEKLAERFLRVEGFAPYTFACAIYPPSFCAGERETPALTRSLKHALGGTKSIVRVHGSVRTAWHRRVVAALKRAGYACRPSRDETQCERWLRGGRQRDAELRLLRALGPDGLPGTWPSRSLTPGPETATRRDRRAWSATMAAASASGIAWNEWAVGFDRSGQRPCVVDEAHGLCVHVSVLGLASLDGRWIEVYASVFNASEVALPLSKASGFAAGVERSIGREFRRSGFRQSFRAPLLWAVKQVPTAAAAARESAGIFDRLVEGRG
jgi:hypothetical protein